MNIWSFVFFFQTERERNNKARKEREKMGLGLSTTPPDDRRNGRKTLPLETYAVYPRTRSLSPKKSIAQLLYSCQTQDPSRPPCDLLAALEGQTQKMRDEGFNPRQVERVLAEVQSTPDFLVDQFDGIRLCHGGKDLDLLRVGAAPTDISRSLLFDLSNVPMNVTDVV